MPDLERARPLAMIVRAAVLLRHFIETRHTYGVLPDDRTALELTPRGRKIHGALVASAARRSGYLERAGRPELDRLLKTLDLLSCGPEHSTRLKRFGVLDT